MAKAFLILIVSIFIVFAFAVIFFSTGEEFQNKIAVFKHNNEMVAFEAIAQASDLQKMGQLEKSEVYLKKAFEVSKNKHDTHYYLILEELGNLCLEQNKLEEAMGYYKEVLEHYEKGNDPIEKVSIYNAISYLKFKQGNRQESMEYALKALDNLHVITSASMKAQILDTIACAYELNEDYTQAEKYMRLAIEQAEINLSFDSKLKASLYSRLVKIIDLQKNKSIGKKCHN